MKTVMKKLLSLMLVAVLLISAIPFQASADEVETLPVPVYVYINGEAVDTAAKTLVVGAAGVVLDGTTAMGLIRDQEGRSFEKWTNNSGKDVTGNTLSYDWLKEQGEGYSLNIYLTEGAETPVEPSKPAEAPALKELTVTVFEVQENDEDNLKQIGECEFNDKAEYELNKALAEAAIKKVGYTVANWTYRWSGRVEDGQVNLIVTPQYTPENKKAYTLTVMYNNGTSDRKTIDVLEGDNILKVLEKADLSIAKDKDFDGWCFDMNCTVAVDRKDVITGDTTVYAEWKSKDQPGNPGADKEYDVVLRIYINGKISSADKVVDMDAYAKDGKITRDEVKTVVVKYYSAASNDGLTYHGLFTSKTWNKGKYDTDDAVSTIKVNEEGDTYIYVMVKNVDVEEADSTNPKTGDMIFVPAIFMLVSAAAAVLVLSSKKRIVK